MRFKVRIGRHAAGTHANRALRAGREAVGVADGHEVKSGVSGHKKVEAKRRNGSMAQWLNGSMVFS